MNYYLLAKAQSVFGYTCTGGAERKMIAGEPLCTLQDLINIIYIVLHFAVAKLVPFLVVAAIVWGAFIIMTAGSNPNRLTEGRGVMGNAIVGLVIVWGAWAIINTVFYLFGIQLPCGALWYQITTVTC